MAEDTDALFIFGDDLEAILDALEEDEGVQEEFSAAVSNAQTREIICDCGKKYKTGGGYERHRATKHAENDREMVKFYSNFYGTIAVNATKYFKGLTRNAATLLAMEVADSMVVHCKQQKHSTTSSETLPPLTDKQKAGLQYVAGYVLQNLYKKHYRVNSDESQQAMAILKAEKLEIIEQRGALVSYFTSTEDFFED